MAQITQFEMSSDEVILEIDEDKEVDLSLKAEADEALWPDEHSSDEEAFDPEKPEDLQTENAKEADAEEPIEEERSSDDDEDDSCVVPDGIEEYDCEDHDACVRCAASVLDHLLELRDLRMDRKQALAALAEVVCDCSKPL